MAKTKTNGGKGFARPPVKRPNPDAPIIVRIPPDLCGAVDKLAVKYRRSYQQQAEILLQKGLEAVGVKVA